jgi:tetratricopeptide (TPR) repeat protein
MPDQQATHSRLAYACAQAGQLDRAAAGFRRAYELAPNFTDAYNLGDVLHRSGRADEAVEAYQQALTHQPDAERARTLRSIAYGRVGEIHLDRRRWAAAAAAFENALVLNPEPAPLYGNLGHALLQLGRVDEAVARYRKALEIDPDLAEIHFALATAYLELRRPRDAATHLRAFTRLAPDDPRLDALRARVGGGG